MERLVDAVTPLGEALWFRHMEGTEGLSALFEFDVTFHSTRNSLPASAMLGKPITLKLETEDGGGIRYFNGICTRFAGGGREGVHLTYFARMSPWTWLAGRRSDCKIFQHRTVPDIIRDVLGKYPFPISLKLSRSYREWDYCVQYQESDLNFVSRLMEHEGIYYYFEHGDGSHTLVLVDDVAANPMLPGKSTIKYYGPDAAALPDEEHISDWRIHEEVRSGEYIADDYDFTKPRADLTARRKRPFGHSHDAWERYTWPGGYVELGDGEDYAGVRREELASGREQANAHTTVRTMAPGYRFNLERCPRADQNREYLVVAATYELTDNSRMSEGSGAGESEWHIGLVAQPTALPFRPDFRTPKPLTHGPQTAVVVGPRGEEIYTDEYSRVKVQFHWDRYGASDENSSCWIRVAQPWAGEKWGFIHVPRIGQEVVVDFIGGDPDYPMITGSVYNADQMPPYALPENKTASGIKSRSTKGGAAQDFNEIRMEDSKGNEQLYLHAQRNLDTVVEQDESRMVGRDRQTRVLRNDHRFVAVNDKHVVGKDQAVQVEGTQSVAVKVDQDNSVQGDQSNMVSGDITQSVGGALKERVASDHQESVGGDHKFTVSGDEKNNVGGKQLNFVRGGRKSIVSGKELVVATGQITSFGAEGYNIVTPVTLTMQSTTRTARVLGSDDETVVGVQSTSVGGARTTTVGATDSTTVGGASSLTASAVAVSAGAITMTGAASIAVTGATVTISGASITLTGAVTIVGPLTVAGPVTALSVVSPLYTPGVGNLA